MLLFLLHMNELDDFAGFQVKMLFTELLNDTGFSNSEIVCFV